MRIFEHLTIPKLLLAATILASPVIAVAFVPTAGHIAVGVSVQIAPPPLPTYDQPPLTEAGAVWTPGYWQWAETAGYRWMPGVWVQPPSIGLLWTPPYWRRTGGTYVFRDGYWGAHVGFYGGINYGFGYTGVGFGGGRWAGDRFVYNRTVNNFGSLKISDFYEKTLPPSDDTHISYVGRGGLSAEPTIVERLAEHDQHIAPTQQQTQRIAAAVADPALAASGNDGLAVDAAGSRRTAVEATDVMRPKPVGAGERVSELDRAARPAGAITAHSPEAPHVFHRAAGSQRAAAQQVRAENGNKD